MKKHMILAAIAATALCTSCSNEEDFSNQEATPVSFTINKEVTTRMNTAANGETYKTTLDNTNDHIGIYAIPNLGTSSVTNKEYKFDNNGKLTATDDSDLSINYNSTTSIYAYAPYSAVDATESSVIFSVKEDQSNADDFNASNFLTYTGSVTYNKDNTEPSVTVNFSPALALVRVHISKAIGATTSKIWMKVKPTVTWTFPDTYAESGDVTNIVMYHENSGENSSTEQIFTAFVPAQAIAASTQFLIIKTDNGTYALTPQSEIKLKQGSVNKINLTIGEDGSVNVSASTGTTIDWSTNELGNNKIDEDNGKAQPIQLIAEGTINANTTITPISTLSNISGTGWYAYITSAASPNNTIVYDSDANAVHIKNIGTSTWNQRGLIYCVDSKLIKSSISKKFKLEFKAKTSAANTTKNSLRIGVFENESIDGNGLYFSINNNAANYPKVTATESLTSYANAITIDFNTFGTYNTSASTWTTQTPTFNKVIIYICTKDVKSISDADVEFWVNNFTLTEVFE